MIICSFGQVNESSSILSVFVGLLGMSLEQYIYLSQMFLYIPLLISIPGAWLLDRFGLQVAVYVTLFLAVIRNSARVLLFSADLEGWKEYRLAYWLVTGVAQISVVVIYYLLPLKVSENWFSARERPIAWTMLGVMPTVGTAIVQLIIPHFVHDTKTIHPLIYLNLVGVAVSIVAILGCVNRPQPRRPPTERSLHSKQVSGEPVWLKLKRLMLDWNVMVQMVTGATFAALGAAINSVMQDIFEGAGLNQVFCGQFLATQALVSFGIQMFASTSMKSKSGRAEDDQDGGVGVGQDDQTTNKHMNERQRLERATFVCKAYMVAIGCSFLFYAATLNFHHLTGGGGGGQANDDDDDDDHEVVLQTIVRYQWVLVMIGSTVHTALRCWSAPVFNEMNAGLIAGSVSEATFGAGSTVVFALLANVYSVVFVKLRRTAEGAAPEAGAGFNSTVLLEEGELEETMVPVELLGRPDHMRANYLHSVVFASAVCIVATCLYVFTFDGRPKRSRNLIESGAQARHGPPSVRKG